ncbi:hypothetical protein LINPERHAP2_LOCUS31042 [Linum perenne]
MPCPIPHPSFIRRQSDYYHCSFIRLSSADNPIIILLSSAVQSDDLIEQVPFYDLYDDSCCLLVFSDNLIFSLPSFPLPLLHRHCFTVDDAPHRRQHRLTNHLPSDQAYGVLVGKLRWKFGVLRSEGNGVYDICDVWVGLKRLLGVTGQVPLLASPHCTVDV